ncbi:isochorismatase family cysteine hydrolase [Mycoplasma seminis]|uniref:Isochorismatase family cysteine hydrolase n=1 Tax=Mycoplasma seminis TaxID=512749 RepID=A0ABY9H9C9_9MOLU|nr:isochorismatase family cysteine hydrolase [Mycoplasma seminis]WLP85189.1 isochorismatase family cysteine hydrolase [Mycoplasma seminis]
MNKRLLIVVDMLNGFAYEGALASNNIKDIIPTIQDIVQNFDNNLFVCDHHYEDDLEMQVYPQHCLANSTQAQIVPQLQPYVKEILYKNTTNAFWDIPVNLWDKYDEFYIVGCCSDICVLQLTLSLKTYLNKLHADKKIFVYKDAIATYDAPQHDAKEFNKFAIELLKNAGVIVKRWEM